MKTNLIFALALAAILSVGAAAQTAPQQPAAPAAKPAAAGAHHQQMMALFDRVNSTWKNVETASTPQAKDAALKAHGAALSELTAAHQKMASDPEMMNMCREMMEKHHGPHHPDQEQSPKK